MKKHGFTLSEILVTLGVIGIVAALTIPTLSVSTKKKTYASTLAATVSTLENAFTTMIAKEGVEFLSETEAWQYMDSGADVNKFGATLSKYLSLASFENAANSQYKIVLKNGVHIEMANFTFSQNWTPTVRENLKGLGVSETSLASQMHLDVNGDAPPNQPGRDQFAFALMDSGKLQPYGGRVYAYGTGHTDWLWTGNDATFSCVNGALSIGCTARLVENGYNMDY